MREMRLSSSMSGMWKQSMALLLRHQQTKGLATARRHLNHCATCRLYPTDLGTLLGIEAQSSGGFWAGAALQGGPHPWISVRRWP